MAMIFGMVVNLELGWFTSALSSQIQRASHEQRSRSKVKVKWLSPLAECSKKAITHNFAASDDHYQSEEFVCETVIWGGGLFSLFVEVFNRLNYEF